MNDFVPIKGYEEYYKISPRGEIFSSFYGRIRKPSISDGYPRIILYRPGEGGKSFTIHRLLALHFIPNPLGLPQVNHIDGNRGNFDLANLEWCTASYNLLDANAKRPHKSGWGTTRPLVNRIRRCELCSAVFQYKRKSTRFCSNTCAAQWRVVRYPYTVTRPRDQKTGRLLCELIEKGVIKL